MVLGPVSPTDSTENFWAQDAKGITGLQLESLNGGTFWLSFGGSTIGAFDVLSGTSAPEPGSPSLLLGGLCVIYIVRRRRYTSFH
jgi:hypothetical protein